MRDNKFILGIVRKIVRNRSLLIGQLEPLFESAPDLSKWSREYNHEEAKEEFPNRGIISWLGARPSLDEGSLWQFRVEDQEFEDDNPQHDAFRVAPGAGVVREVLDLRRYGTADEIRSLVTEGGVSLNFFPSESVYLWVEDEHWVGPVRLQRRDGTHWHLPAWQETQPLAPLPLHKATTDISELHIGSPRLFLAPRAEPGVKLGLVDWSADAMVVKRVLTRIRKQDPKSSDVLRLTPKAIELAGQIVAGSDRYLQAQQIQRAAAVVAALGNDDERSKEFVEDMIGLPSVAAGIEQAKQDAIRNAQKSFDAEMSGQNERLLGVQKEIENSQKVLEELDAEAGRRRAALAGQIESLGAEMESRLQAILEKPAKLLAEVGILRAALGSGRAVEARAESAAVQAAGPPPAVRFGKPPSPFENWKLGEPIREAKQIRLALGTAARSASVSLSVVQALHAGFVAGSVPVLYGADSYNVLRAYASSITGGRLLWLPIAAGLIEASDLFGRSEPQTGKFAARPGGLADVMREASKLPGLVMVILDGLNHSAVDAYLSPVVACYAGAQKGEAARHLAIVHPSQLADDDPYASLATLAWPPNILLAGVLAKDVTTIPPSPEFWLHSPLICVEADMAETDKGTGKALAPIPSASGWMEFNLWQELRRSLPQKENPELQKSWSTLADGELRLPLALRDGFRSYYEAMVNWPTEPKVALLKAMENAVVPYFVAKAATEKFLELAGKIVSDREALRKHVEVVEEALS
jgi:hypothetical protein